MAAQDMISAENQQPTAEVVVQLTTKLKDESLHVPEEPIVVPANLGRYKLSELVNQLLGRDKPVPFDFLVTTKKAVAPLLKESGSNEQQAAEIQSKTDGKPAEQVFLRQTLQHLQIEYGISSEKTLEVEYVLALPPMQTNESEASDDWISCVRYCEKNNLCVVSSYDGSLKVFDLLDNGSTSGAAEKDGENKQEQSLQQVFSERISEAGITSVEVIEEEQNAVKIVLADKDGVVYFGRVCVEKEQGSTKTSKNKTSSTSSSNPLSERKATFALISRSEDVVETSPCAYEKAVECIAVSGKKQLVATGGWDWSQGVKIWNVQEVFEPKTNATTSASLKRKNDNGNQNENSGTATASFAAKPEFTVQTKNLKNRVTGLVFLDECSLLISSLDATVCVVDLVANTVLGSVLHTGLAVLQVDYSKEANILACAHESGRISFWTKKVNKQGSCGAPATANDFSFEMLENFPMNTKYHNGAISSMRFHGPHKLLSAGLDGVIRVNDPRSKTALQTIKVAEEAAAQVKKAVKPFPLKITSVRACSSAVGDDEKGIRLLSGASDGKVRLHFPMTGNSAADEE